MISDWLRRTRPQEAGEQEPSDGEMLNIPVETIAPNPYQPRQVFSEEGIVELADSIRRVGVLEPVLVRPEPDDPSRYQLLVGERRLRASRVAGLDSIPAVVRRVDDRDMALFGLVENLQREDLHPLEEAAAFRRMLDEFNLTQGELAEGLGFSQSSISNKLRLLALPERVREAVLAGGLGERHARCLLNLPEGEPQLELVEQIRAEGLSVKETEARIQEMMSGPPVQSGRKRPLRGVVRDLRIFRNGMLQTIQAMREAGFDVQLEEQEVEDGFRMVVEVSGRRPRDVEGDG